MRADVAIVANRPYLSALLVTAVSVAVNARKDTDLRFHLFLEDVSDDDYQEVRRVIRSIRFCEVIRHEFDMNRLADLNMTAWRGANGTRNVWIRTFFAELLPDVDWLVYLDCDILCLRDVESFIEQGADDVSIVCVRDSDRLMQKKESNWIREVAGIKIDGDEYFNAGVLLMNLNRLREIGIVQSVVSFIANKGCPYAKDQTTLNALLVNDKKLVSDVFNRAQSQLGTKGIEDNPIIHYCCGVPWNRSVVIPMARRISLWWRFVYKNVSNSYLVEEMKIPLRIYAWKKMLYWILSNKVAFAVFAPFINVILKRKGYSLMKWVREFGIIPI